MVPPFSDCLPLLPSYSMRCSFVPTARDFFLPSLVPLWIAIFSFWSTIFASLGCTGFARHYFRSLGWFLLFLLLRCFTSQAFSPWNPPLYTSGLFWVSRNHGEFSLRISLAFFLLWKTTSAFRTSSRPLFYFMPRYPPDALNFFYCNLLFKRTQDRGPDENALFVRLLRYFHWKYPSSTAGPPCF